MVFILLAGCSNKNEQQAKNEQLLPTIMNAQKIEWNMFRDEQETKVITDEQEIQTFIERLQLEDWEVVSAIPEGAVKEKTFSFYQEETVKLGEDKKQQRPIKKMATFVTYQDLPYVTMEVALMTIHVRVPNDAGLYLSSL